MKIIHLITLASVALAFAPPSFAEASFTITEMCSTTSNTVGNGVVLTLEGQVAQHPERAQASGGPPGLFGALIYGPIAANPPLPWGNGSLCISPFHPGNGRYRVSLFSSSGMAQVMMDGSSAPAVFPYAPGETGYFQYLYRDTHNWNLSNAIAITMAP